MVVIEKELKEKEAQMDEDYNGMMSEEEKKKFRE